MVGKEVGAPVERTPEEVVDLAHSVVATRFAGELEAFDDIVLDYRRDPEGTVRGVRLHAPVGIGVELAAMTPYVLSAAALVGGVLVEKATGGVYDSVRDWLTRAWARRRGKDSAGPAPQIDDAEAGRVTVMITIHLTGAGADEVTAGEIARYVVDGLVTGKHESSGGSG